MDSSRRQFVHGSPADEDEYLLSVIDALHSLLHCNAPLTFYGHTHIQGGFVLHQDHGSEIQPPIDAGDTFTSSELRLKRNAKYLINPGSVGQPRDGDWRAAFAHYDSESSVISFYRVPYDVTTGPAAHIATPGFQSIWPCGFPSAGNPVCSLPCPRLVLVARFVGFALRSH